MEVIDAANANALNNLSTKGQASAKSQRRGGILRYPLEALTGTTDYLQINIIEYKRTPNQLTRPAGFGANTKLLQQVARHQDHLQEDLLSMTDLFSYKFHQMYKMVTLSTMVIAV